MCASAMVVLIGTAGCSGPPTAPSTAPTLSGPVAHVQSAQRAPRPVPNEAFGIADIVFLQQMVPHHRQAVELAELAVTRTGSPQIRQLAKAVGDTAPAEIADMARWLAALGIDIGTGSGVHSHGGGMTDQDVVDLGGLSGPEFDERFVELMTAHAVGAMELTKGELAAGISAGARKLAGEISDREWDRVNALRAIG